MITIQYYIHILLQSKYKFLFYILVYIIVLNIYYTSFNDITIVECMKKAEPNTTITHSTEREYIQYLEESAWAMDKRIAELEQLTRRLTDEVSTLTVENKRLSDRITLLEYKGVSPKSEPKIDKID